MPRSARKKSESGIYHVMIRGVNKQNIFESDSDYNKFLYILKEYKQLCGFKLYAYCLMSNHVHLLIKEEKDPIENIFRRIGTKYVYWYNATHKRVGHLFQDRYKSEPVDSDEYFLTVLRYIHQNPVKAGICKSVNDYRYCSYGEYIGKPFITDIDFALELIGNDFIEFNNTYTDEKCLDMSANDAVLLTDEMAEDVFISLTKCTSSEQFGNFNKEDRCKFLIKLRENGLSLRQIKKCTGISDYESRKIST